MSYEVLGVFVSSSVSAQKSLALLDRPALAKQSHVSAGV